MSALIRARISTTKTFTSCFQKGFSNATTKRLHCQFRLQQKFQHNLLHHGKYNHFQFIRFTQQVASTKEEIVPTGRSIVTLRRLEDQMRARGMIQYRDFRPCMERILKEDTIGRQDAALLLRFTGSCLQDKTQRQELTEQVWSRLKEMNFPFETIHYNTLLLVYAENDYAYDPVNISSQMESNGVVPNRVTCQRLLRQYCISGELEKAMQILQHLKTKGFPVTESVFCSLILGYFKLNDLAGVEHIYQTMLDKDVLPSAETYTVLLSGYAGTDLDKFKQTLKDASVDTVSFYPSEYIDISEALIKAGHKDLIPKVLKSLKQTVGSNMANQVHLIKQFLAAGNEDLSDQFAGMISMNKRDPELGRVYRELTMSTPQSPQVKGITTRTKVIKEFYFKNVEKGLELIETLHKEGGPVEDYLFYPAICVYRDQRDKEGIYGVMKQVISMVPKSSQLFVPKSPRSLYQNFFYPAVHTLGETNFDDIVRPLVEMGYDKKILLNEYLIWLYNSKTTKEDILNFVNKRRDEIDLKEVFGVLISLSDHVEFPFKIISTLEDFTTEEKEVAFGYCFMKLLTAQSLSPRTYFYQLCMLDEMGMKMIVPSKGVVKNQLPMMFNREKEVFNRVVIEGDKKDFDITTSKKFGIIEIIGKLCIDIGPSEVSEFSDAMYNKDFEKAKKYISKDMEDTPRTILVMASLVIINSAMKDLPKAQKYWNMLKKKGAQYNSEKRLNSLSCLYYCNLLLEMGQYEDALNTFKEQAKNLDYYFIDLSWSDRIPLRNVTDITKSVIQHIISIPDEQLALQLEDGLSNLFKHTKALRRTFITSLIEKGDSDKVKNYFLAFMERYGERYCMRRVLDMLIKDNKLLDLQQVMEACNRSRSENSNVNELICAFVSAGDLKKAKDLCLVQGFHADNSCLQYACDEFVEHDMVTELENLIAVTKNLRGIDRKMLFESGVNLYAKVSDFDKALEMLVQFDEENIIPSAEMLANLAASLQAANKEVPFNIPSEDEIRKEKLLKDKEKKETLPNKTTEGKQKVIKEKLLKDKEKKETLPSKTTEGKQKKPIEWQSGDKLINKITRDEFDDFLNDPENEKHCNMRLWKELKSHHPKLLLQKFEDHIENKVSAKCKQMFRDEMWRMHYLSDPEKAKQYLEGRNDDANLSAFRIFEMLLNKNQEDKVADMLNDESLKNILSQRSVRFGRIGLMKAYCNQEKVEEALNEYEIVVKNNIKIPSKHKELLKNLLIKFDRPVPELLQFEDPETTSEDTVKSESSDKTETLENNEISDSSSSDSDSSDEEVTKV